MAGRKDKYIDCVKPFLKDIEQFVREGLTERQIAIDKLGISYPAFNKYKVKHKELALALREAKRDLAAEIEESLYKRAMGFTYEESKTRITQNPDGTETSFTEIVTKQALPDVGAQIFALKNLKKGQWSNSPAELDIKKKELELKQKIVDKNNF